MAVSVSVCVPTYRRPIQLAAALDALLALDPPAGGYEIVVVDDGSPVEDGIAAVLEKAAVDATVPLRWFRLDENRGPAAARNRAWRAAHGEWIAFTDDDCRVRRDWLVELARMAEAESADVVQGRTLPDPARQHLLSEPFARSLRVESMDGFYQTCNILYRRALLEQLDGLDERHRLIGDDTDLGWRALEAGARAVFAPGAVVEHEVAVRDWRADLRSRRRWTDGVRVVRRHPAARRLVWRPYVYRREHVPVLALAAAAPLLLSRRGRTAFAVAALTGLARDVVVGGSPAGARAALLRRAGDVYEVALLARASIRERTLLL